MVNQVTAILIMLIPIIIMLPITAQKIESVEFWGTRIIQDLKGNGNDTKFLRTIHFSRTQLTIWSCATSPRMKKGGKPPPTYMHIFLHHNQLVSGKVLEIYFRDAFTDGHLEFLPQAQEMPFSLEEYPTILHRLGISVATKASEAVYKTLKICDERHDTSSIAFCASSYEDMVDKVSDKVSKVANQGPMKVKPLSTSKLPSSAKRFQNYTIVDTVVELEQGSKGIVCHIMSYPYAVYFCHKPEGESKAYQVSLAAEDGTLVSAVVSCHFSTGSWSPMVEAFEILGTKPGDTVCHALPPVDLLWIPLSTKKLE